MTSRNLLSIVVLGAAGVLLAGQVRQLLTDPTIWPPDDFVEYWAAAKLTLNGQNPFDGALLLPLQQHAGRDTQDPIMMWNPPWALPAVLPLGVLPAREAQLLWLLVHFVVAGFCADRLWLLLGGPRNWRGLSWAVSFAFMPTVLALSSGQISPLLLLGAVLFLECERRIVTDRRWEYLAGAATVLVAIKPHLAYLLWVGIGADALVRGRWRVVVGGAGTGLVCAMLPLAFNPEVWHQYADAMGNRPPAQWLSPTPGTVLRLLFGAEHFRLQFVSVALGAGWFVWYRVHKRGNWNWREQLPLVLLVSFCTAPYGAWPFDMVLLLPAVFAIVVRSCPVAPLPEGKAEPARVAPCAPDSRSGSEAPSLHFPSGRGATGIGGLLAVNLGCLVMNLFQLGSFWFLWVAPAVLLLYAFQMRHAPGTNASR
ncbi:MAG TPA: glycosyltransferase family 87 protein, partial [Gemmata sp.]